MVRATYNVNSTGEISNVRVNKGIDPSLDAELVRVTKLIPKDVALSKTGDNAASNVAISALFRLQDEKGNYSSSEKEDIDLVVVVYDKLVEKK